MKNSHKRLRCRINRLSNCLFPEMEENLYQWVLEHRKQGHCVSGTMIKCYALQFLHDHPTLAHANFQASEGWFYRFLRRRKLFLRRVTTSERDLPQNVDKIIDNFLKDCHENFVIPSSFDLSNVANMDQTSIYLAAPETKTYTSIRDKRVAATTTGQTQTRVSVAFAATAAGDKFKPIILIPRKKPLKNFVPPRNNQ